MKIVYESLASFYGNTLNEQDTNEKALDIVDKCKENFDRFKSAANRKLEKYIEFVDALKEKRSEADESVESFYKLYDGDYSVAITISEEGEQELSVLKHTSEGLEKIYSSTDEEAIKSYQAFYDVFKEHIEEVRNEKQKEEEEDQLKDFLNESRKRRKKK